MTEKDFNSIILLSLGKIEAGVIQNEKDHIKIEAALIQNEKDHAEIIPLMKSMPLIELGLNNHLHTHSNITKFVMYPVVVTVIVGIIGLFSKIVLRLF